MKLAIKCPFEDLHLIKAGSYKIVKTGKRKLNNEKFVQRYQCQSCKKYFSTNQIMGRHHQKKPELNEQIFKLYSKGMTLRGIAEVLGVSKTTVYEKFLFIAKKCKEYHLKAISHGYKDKYGNKPIVIFDEMETHEQTKLKPLSIGVLFDFNNRKIIHVNVGEMKTRGRGLVKIWDDVKGAKGYATRTDKRSDLTLEAFLIASDYYSKMDKVVLLTDHKPLYGNLYKFLDPKKFQHVFTERGKPVKIRKSKKIFSRTRTKIIKPIFKLRTKPYLYAKPPYHIDHYKTSKEKFEKYLTKCFDSFNKLCAVIRNNTSRLRRTSFINTQKPDRLELNLFMFVAYYNDYKFSEIMHL